MPGPAGDQEHFRFGDVAVALGLLSLDQVRQAATRLAQLHEDGRRLSLGELLIEEGHLTAAEVRLVLSEQGVELLVCPREGCRLRFNISSYDPGKVYRCKTCSSRLGLPGLLDSDMGYDFAAGDSAASWPAATDEPQPDRDDQSRDEQ